MSARVASRVTDFVSAMVGPARSTALDKLDDGRRAIEIATDWRRSRLDSGDDSAETQPASCLPAHRGVDVATHQADGSRPFDGRRGLMPRSERWRTVERHPSATWRRRATGGHEVPP